ncbi:uncharacterized protein KGF55_000631 [Candida pseudojiufengensis]|uniref:uncharacterized protein n=1 Tax=Candida pseudojiufengensis TaxID=497109 RepID=UPI00222534E6|nr:uncharacterized protein KGF55_000631 [Candida pseudojiufengensis]KAI5966322.1 hypothetical protein KGF55_000631 [Candida pseudojiufengensis]
MEDEKLQRLQEMGFSKFDSEQALRQANNNVEVAITYLFDETRHPGQDQLFNEPYQTDTIQISNPEEIPHFNELNNYEPNYNDNNWAESIVEENTLFKNTPEFERSENSPPAVIPTTLNSGYISALFVVFSQINYLKQIILNKDLKQEFTEDWYNPQQDSNTNFLIELQRLFGFFTSLSQRAFISANGLCNSLPEDLLNVQSQTWEEVWNNIANYFIKEIGNNLNQDLEDFFISKFRMLADDNDIRYFKVIGVDYFNREHSVTETLNGLISKSGNYEAVAPILAMEFQGTDYPETSSSFTIEEYIFPEFHVSKYKSFIDKMDLTKTQIANERKALTSKMMLLTSFEGKKIKSILENTKTHLAKIDKDSSDDISKLADNIQIEYSQLSELLSKTNANYTKFDSSNPDHVINLIKVDPSLKVPSKYILIAALFSESQYLYRTDRVNENGPVWTAFGRMKHEFKTEVFSYEDVVNYLTEEFNQTNRNILLIYADETVLNHQETEISPNLVEFFKKDNELLKKQIEASEAEDLKSDENDISLLGNSAEDIVETERIVNSDSNSD